VVATEAWQCPTLLQCGYGAHRIEGIGDKHVPWIHNVRNTDMVCAVDDERCMSLLRVFNEDAGLDFLHSHGVPAAVVEQLPLLGISSICNLVAAVKVARYYELSSHDVIFIPLTDSMELYQSRVDEQHELRGPLTRSEAACSYARHLEAIGIDHLRELNYYDRKALHNLKYFTWVEQQQRDVVDLNRLWDPDFWPLVFKQVDEWDRLIEEFNERVGLQRG
jgi:hypothetical protein